MNISYNWLREYVPVSLDPQELSDQLTMLGLEVDGVEVLGSNFDGVVVGNVLSVDQHPDADRLKVCSVSVGSDAPLQIVCGANNVATGQNVAVATIGTKLVFPEDSDGNRAEIKIKKSKLRGVMSEGMICAEDELGLSGNHDGIMVLSEDATAGQLFADYL